MTMKIRVSGATETITSGKVMVGGVLRSIKTIKIKTGGVLHTAVEFVSDLSAAVSPGAVYALGDNSVLSTDPASCNVIGGRGPYSYSWTLVSHSGGNAPSADNPSFATTRFTQTGLGLGDSNTATFKCTVTDDTGQTAESTVLAQFDFEDFS